MRLAPVPAPASLPANPADALEAGDGVFKSQGLPVGSDGNVIPASFPDLPSSGSVPDVVLDEASVQRSQDQIAASQEIPPGVQVEEVYFDDSPAPAPGPAGYLAPNSAPFGSMAPSTNRIGRRLLGGLGDLGGLLSKKKAPEKPTFSLIRITQNTLDVYPRNLGLTYKALSPSSYTLFASGHGPRVQDIFQTGLGDCWLQATMMSTLESGDPIRIEDVYGDFKTFEMSFRVRSFPVIVTTDSRVLFKGDNLWTNAAPTDPASGKRIAWPLLWTKAYGILATRYPELVTVSEPDAKTPQPCTGRGWCDLDGGWAYTAVLAHTGRGGYVHNMRGTIAAKQAGSTVSDSAAFSKLFSRQVNVQMLDTLSPGHLKNNPQYRKATKSVDVGIYRLQIVDTDEILYSVTHRPTSLTFVLCFNHVMSVTLSSSGKRLDVANPWGSNPTLNAAGKQGPDSTNRYITQIPLYVVEFAFNALHFG